MNPRYLLATMAVSTMALGNHASAHGFAGDHMFISTLLLDDPNVADEASLPTFSFLPQDAGGGTTSQPITTSASSWTNASPRILALPSTTAITGSPSRAPRPPMAGTTSSSR